MQVRKMVVAIAVMMVVGAVVGTMIVGCGGGTSQVVPPDGDFVATYVGRAVCATCHGHIDNEYSDQAHGLDFRTAHGRDLVGDYSGGCASCHTTGMGEASGYVADGSTPHLEGIGCEECHGPGSEHAADPSELNIAAVPTAETSCWDCHVAGGKHDLDSLRRAVTDADLRGSDPDSISVHHPQAPFLLGVYGYNRTDEPGPHRLVDNTCVTCHLNPVQSATPLHIGVPADHGEESLHPDLTTCAYCHGSEGTSQDIFEELEEDIILQLIALGGEDAGAPDHSAEGGFLAAFAAANSIDASSDPDSAAVQAYKGARHNYMFVLADASYGTHNPEFARDLLEDARALLGH